MKRVVETDYSLLDKKRPSSETAAAAAAASRKEEEDDDDRNVGEEEEEVRKLLLQVRRAHSQNTEMRSKFPDEPERFFDSELALDDAIQALEAEANNGISAGVCACPEGIEVLQDLLLHENEDIVADVVTVLSEMSDLSSLEENETEILGRKHFAEAIVKSNLCIPRLMKLVGNENTEAETIYTIISCLDHFCEACPDDFCLRLLNVWHHKNDVSFLNYIAGRIKDVAKKCSTVEDDIGKYSVEFIASLLACNNDDIKKRKERKKERKMDNILNDI